MIDQFNRQSINADMIHDEHPALVCTCTQLPHDHMILLLTCSYRWKDSTDRMPHWTSQHAGPYWLRDALLQSNYSTDVLDEVHSASTSACELIQAAFLGGYHDAQEPAG